MSGNPSENRFTIHQWRKTKGVPTPNTAEVFDDICNWTHSALIVSNSPNRGLGVFTTAVLPRGEPVVVYGGRVFTNEQLGLLPFSADMVLQIEESLYYVPINREQLGIGERVNHSCNPNVGFSGQMCLVAIENIAAGEEIKMDYALCDAREAFHLECNCGEPECRGTIRGTDWKREELQDKYFDYFQPFLQRRISGRTRRLLGNS